MTTTGSSGGGGGDGHGVAPLLLVSFIGTLGFSAVLPVLPDVVLSLGGDTLVYGLLTATYPAFQLLGAPVLGRWSDRVGRKRILLASQLGTCAAWAMFLLAVALPAPAVWPVVVPLALLFVARMVDGLTGGNVSVAYAYLADVTPEAGRKAAFGRMSVATNLGFVAGPALAGVLSLRGGGAVGPAAGALAVSLVAAVLIWRRLPESLPCLPPPAAAGREVGKVFGQEPRDCFAGAAAAEPGAVEILRRPRIGGLMLAYFLIFLGFNLYYVAFPIHALTAYGWSTGRLGAYFALLGLTLALVQGPLLGALSKAATGRTLVVGGGAVLTAGFVVFALGGSAAAIPATLLFALGNGLMWPSYLALLASAAGRDQGAVQGFGGSVGSLASILGLVAGGLLYPHLGAHLFFLTAIAIALAAAVVWRLTGGNPPAAEA